MIPPLYDHQQQTVDFGLKNPRMMDFSDPGTGKTRSHLEIFSRRKELDPSAKCLVLAPKSILEVSWFKDCESYTPHLRPVVAYAHNRADMFKVDADIYITNWDAAKWLLTSKEFKAAGINHTLILDESTYIKNRTAQRSKAVAKLAKGFKVVTAMTGTPIPNTVLDVWHQAKVVDGGEALGSSFFAFRAAVCAPQQVGPRPDMIQWTDRPGSEDAVADLLADLSIRHRFEACIDIPENTTRTIELALGKKHRAQYQQMVDTAVLELTDGTVDAVTAAVLWNKLLQIAAGGVYSDGEGYHILDTARTELVADLAEEREHSVIAFNWRHQRDQLVEMFRKRDMAVAVIDGSVPAAARTRAVNDFQAGLLRALLCHPASASHGLTLTRGTTTIWASPTWSAEHYQQFTRRIYRAGQTRKTETIHIAAEDTIDKVVYDRLAGKLTKMSDMLKVLQRS